MQAALPRLEALIAEQPDRTLAELREALRIPASVTTSWRAIARLGFTVNKTVTRRLRARGVVGDIIAIGDSRWREA